MSINLFIDTNIWLSFYNPDPEIQILEKLFEKIKSGEINLLIPAHQIDEILRNKEGIISKEVKKMTKFIGKINSIESFPELLKEDFDSFIENVEEKTQNHKDVAYKEELEIDQLLNKIIPESKTLNENSKIITLANERTLIRGNPPRKDNAFKSCADSIIWETILYHSKNKEDIIVISNDGDYSSEIDSSKIKLFIKKEWKNKKNSKIKLYKSIGSFFHEELKDTEIKEEEIKSEEESSKAVSLDRTSTFLIPTAFGIGSQYPPTSGAPISPFTEVEPYSFSIKDFQPEKEIRCPSCGKIFYTKTITDSFVYSILAPNVKCSHCDYEFLLS